MQVCGPTLLNHYVFGPRSVCVYVYLVKFMDVICGGSCKSMWLWVFAGVHNDAKRRYVVVGVCRRAQRR